MRNFERKLQNNDMDDIIEGHSDEESKLEEPVEENTEQIDESTPVTDTVLDEDQLNKLAGDLPKRIRKLTKFLKLRQAMKGQEGPCFEEEITYPGQCSSLFCRSHVC